MSEQPSGYPIQTAAIVLILVGGGWYFLRHFEIGGLDNVTIRSRSGDAATVGYQPNRSVPRDDAVADQTSSLFAPAEAVIPPDGDAAGRPSALIARTYADRYQIGAADPMPQMSPAEVSRRRYPNLRIASWAMGNFGPSKLANDAVRHNVVRILRQFDVIAVQQVAAIERDLLPRLMDAINEGQSGVAGVPHYDFILSHPSRNATGSESAPEQLAFIFDIHRVEVDRTQTYTVSDPADRMTHDPVVAWFRAAQPDPRDAWTFSLVNVRIELTRARQEVALLPSILSSVRTDGRGEDDVVVAGLFQADDAYLIPTLSGSNIQAAVRSLPTDVMGRHQTSNLLVDQSATTEFLGRGGPLNFLRAYNLTVDEAESISPNLPVYAEFTAFEGGG